jgi:hypothetical protein
MAGRSQRLDAGEFARWWDETGEYELSQILYWKWDPIAVSDCFPYSAHEYDSYAAEVITAARRDHSIDGIAELFAVIENERMGLRGGSPDRRRALANDILAWLQSSQDRWVEFGPLRR